MNYWRGKDVMFKLSLEGRSALSGVYETELVQVFVQWADELGLWVVRDRQETGEISVQLIKRPYFQTAQLDVVLPEPVPARKLGFQKQN